MLDGTKWPVRLSEAHEGVLGGCMQQKRKREKREERCKGMTLRTEEGEKGRRDYSKPHTADITLCLRTDLLRRIQLRIHSIIFLKYISVPSASRGLTLLQILVLFREHLPEDEAHSYTEPTRQNANRIRMGVGRTPGLLPCISVRVKLMPAAAMA